MFDAWAYSPYQDLTGSTIIMSCFINEHADICLQNNTHMYKYVEQCDEQYLMLGHILQVRT
jgi:hypothetical protein